MSEYELGNRLTKQISKLQAEVENLKAKCPVCQNTGKHTVMCDEPLQMIDEPCPVCTGKVIAKLQAEVTRLEGEIASQNADLEASGGLILEELGRRNEALQTELVLLASRNSKVILELQGEIAELQAKLAEMAERRDEEQRLNIIKCDQLCIRDNLVGQLRAEVTRLEKAAATKNKALEDVVRMVNPDRLMADEKELLKQVLKAVAHEIH